MIIKSYEVSKIDLKKNLFYLFYGENEGYKKQIIEEKFKKIYIKNVHTYEENEILQNQESFFNTILTKSFFENEKLIIINRATDKIKIVIDEILVKEIEDLVLIVNAQILEKKSKLRSLFEKNKKTISVAFYADNNQTLSTIINNFFRENKIRLASI